MISNYLLINLTYKTNSKNNFEQYYIDCLDIINKTTKIEKIK